MASQGGGKQSDTPNRTQLLAHRLRYIWDRLCNQVIAIDLSLPQVIGVLTVAMSATSIEDLSAVFQDLDYRSTVFQDPLRN